MRVMCFVSDHLSAPPTSVHAGPLGSSALISNTSSGYDIRTEVPISRLVSAEVCGRGPGADHAISTSSDACIDSRAHEGFKCHVSKLKWRSPPPALICGSLTLPLPTAEYSLNQSGGSRVSVGRGSVTAHVSDAPTFPHTLPQTFARPPSPLPTETTWRTHAGLFGAGGGENKKPPFGVCGHGSLECAVAPLRDELSLYRAASAGGASERRGEPLSAKEESAESGKKGRCCCYVAMMQ